MAAKRKLAKKPKTTKARTKTKTKASQRTTSKPTIASPTKPGGDGTSAAGVLAGYADWIYGPGEDPTEPTVAATARAGAAAGGDWAGWVKRKLERVLADQLAAPDLPPRKRDRLEAALQRVQGWV